MLHALFDGPVVIPVTLLAVVVCGVSALVRPRWDTAVVLGLLAAIWSRVNAPVEGRVLHTWTEGRGFTEADLLSVAALVVVLITFARSGWRLVQLASRAGRAATTEESLTKP